MLAGPSTRRSRYGVRRRGIDERADEHLGGHRDGQGNGTPVRGPPPPRLPGVIFIGLGAVTAIIGIPGFIVQQLAGPGADGTSFGIMADARHAAPALRLALGATRVDVYDRHYDVKSGFGKPRRREVDDIRTLRYATQSNGGGQRFVSLTAWNDRKKKQFMIFTNYRGYQEFTTGSRSAVPRSGPSASASHPGLIPARVTERHVPSSVTGRA